QVSRSSRTLVRGCPDWTARRPHLAGRLGAAILSSLLSERWPTRRRHDRALKVTERGQERFAALDIDLGSPGLMPAASASAHPDLRTITRSADEFGRNPRRSLPGPQIVTGHRRRRAGITAGRRP